MYIYSTVNMAVMPFIIIPKFNVFTCQHLQCAAVFIVWVCFCIAAAAANSCTRMSLCLKALVDFVFWLDGQIDTSSFNTEYYAEKHCIIHMENRNLTSLLYYSQSSQHSGVCCLSSIISKNLGQQALFLNALIKSLSQKEKVSQLVMITDFLLCIIFKTFELR